MPWTARQFARAIVMPNLVPPVTTVAAARAYRERIIAALPEEADFTPLMTCYLTDGADPAEIARGFEEGVFAAVKLYPAHATTHSAHGVTDIDRVMPVLERMAGIGMPLLIHGEVTDPEVDIFDREAVFIERVLDPLRRRLPELRIVLEHVTTEEAVAYVAAGGPEHRRDDHGASSRHQPQRDLRRRHPAASLLPADRQARDAPPRAAPRRDLGQTRRSFSAPTARRTRSRPRRPHAAAPASSPRRRRWRFTPRYSRRKARSTASRRSPR